MSTDITQAASIVDDKKQGTKGKIDNAIPYQVLTRKYFPILGQLEEVQSFRTLKSDVLSAAQKIVLKYALSDVKMQKASFIQLIQGMEILNKIERLENNQSTENIAHKFSRSIPSEIIEK